MAEVAVEVAWEAADVVSLRISAIGLLTKPRLPEIAEGAEAPTDRARKGSRIVVFAGYGEEEAAVYERAELLSRNTIQGPAVIEEPAATTILEPGDSLKVNRFGHLVMTLRTS